MTIHPLFVAGVLEGVEGTLGEIIGRVEDQKLGALLNAVRTQVAAIRTSSEELFRSTEANRAASEK